MGRDLQIVSSCNGKSLKSLSRKVVAFIFLKYHSGSCVGKKETVGRARVGVAGLVRKPLLEQMMVTCLKLEGVGTESAGWITQLSWSWDHQDLRME